MTCTIGTCDRNAVARQMCNMHYTRWKRTGQTELIRHPKGSGHTDTRGYRLVWYPDHPNARKSGHVNEHWYVMSGALGRPLLPGETVHHKNGVRSDNRIANLELWRGGHPPGQRVQDHVQWALELLDQYADDSNIWPDNAVLTLDAVLARLTKGPR